MSTTLDIKFDSRSFSDTDRVPLLLHEPSISIPISRPDLLTFIHRFDSTSVCQQYITTNSQKQFTLFAYSENIVSWLMERTSIPDNLTEIVIFCALSEDKYYLKKWIRRYSEKIKKIVTYVQLECELLIFGIKYIQDRIKLFKDNTQVLNSLEENYQQLCSTLLNYFNKTISNIDNKSEKM